MDKYIGKRLDGRYEIHELIGVGGMANVYRCNDTLDDREVAIKILKDEYLNNEEFIRRFKNESKAIATLYHTYNEYVNNDYDGDYKSKEEFYDSVERHSEIVFEWKDKSYEICSMDGKRWWFFNVTDDTEVIVNTIEDLMICEIDVERLVDICTKFTVIVRTF